MRIVTHHGILLLLLGSLASCAKSVPPPAAPPPVPAAPAAGAAQDDEAPILRPVKRLDGRILTPEEVAATVERLMAAGKVPGLALAILNDGEVTYLRGFGFRNVEKQQPLTAGTIMYAASITKAMFAYLVMQLVDDGVIDLDKPIAAYLKKPLPEYEGYGDLAGDERWRKFTARILLSHTSGLPNWSWLTADKKLHIYYEPGTRYSYSGEGITVMQLVVEEATGRSLDSLMRERVFSRLGMTRTSMLWSSAFETNYALGYDEEGKVIGHNKRSTVRAAGSADGDVADMARFLRGVLKGEGLSAKSRQEMLSPQIRIRSKYQFPVLSEETTDRDDAIRLSYGLGWGLFWSPYGKAFFKEGHIDGWENYMVAFDDAKSGLIIMTSSSNGESIFPELLASLLGDTYTPSVWEHYGKN
ncbi:MAG TPA: serine hydrolase domain-containing protein [Thermoanaerobaculia bacterium]|nr:serine hydrolase domain-containing protein [Thermoanaerobaculia bacterium]